MRYELGGMSYDTAGDGETEETRKGDLIAHSS